MSTPSSASPAPARPLSLGVIFLTLYIDLIGFSIIFPLGPKLLQHYLETEGTSGLLGTVLNYVQATAHLLGNEGHLPEVLFGGLISSLFSILQFIFAPLWGGLSDKYGRRPILLFTVAGTALSYLIWVFSGSFWLFLASRLLAGAFGGNLSVATAAVADVTSRQERAKAMGLVGAAFGLGLITGPMVGALTASLDLTVMHPELRDWGLHPFSVPALFAFSLGLVNLVWIVARFNETLPAAARGQATEPRLRNPLRAILNLDNPDIRRINVVSFLYSLAFVAMEASLVFVSTERFGYTTLQNGLLLVFLGFCSILTQGVLVRRLLAKHREPPVLAMGLLCSMVGLLVLGVAPVAWLFYVGVALVAVGSGLVNPATSGLISLYAGPAEQGRVLGIYRSLGSLARAITPITAGVIYYIAPGRSLTLYVLAAALALCAWLGSRRLPTPAR